MNSNLRRQFLALPLWALLLTAAAMTLTGTTEQPAATQARPDYMAEAQAILKAEIARESQGQPCVAPGVFAKAGTFPSRVLVSEQNADIVSTSVESMTFDQAWAAAEAGRVTIRCAIA